MTQNTEKWGRAQAKSRYGDHTYTKKTPESKSAPQDPECKHGPDYDNDAHGWVRGMPNESAEGNPCFVPTRTRR